MPLVPGNINVASILAVRNGLLTQVQAGYHLAHTPIVNPGSKRFTLVCGAEASDIATPFLTFNPTKAAFVDRQEINYRALKYELAGWRMYPFDNMDDYRKVIADRRSRGFIQEDSFNKHAERMIVMELQAIGVDKDSVRLKRDVWGNNIVLRFPWAYPGQRKVNRTITFISSDITNPPVWNPTLRALLFSGRVDAYYQKSAVDCMNSMDRYLLAIAGSVRNFMLVSAHTDNFPDPRIGRRLREILEPDFERDPRINMAYVPLFSPDDSTVWLNEYAWHVELFKRK